MVTPIVPPPARLVLLVVLAMAAFAANSLLCRLALRDGAIDAASFTTIRIGSGAMVLWAVARMRDGTMNSAGSWKSAAALFAYAAAFSFAYIELPAGVGALLLFCAVQVTMIGWGLWSGERVAAVQGAGLALAVGGLVGLLWPGLSAPPPGSAALMIAAAAVVLPDEAITLRLVFSSAAIPGGIALMVVVKRRA